MVRSEGSVFGVVRKLAETKVETYRYEPRSEEGKGIAAELKEIFDDDHLEQLIAEIEGRPEEIPVQGDIIPDEEFGGKEVSGEHHRYFNSDDITRINKEMEEEGIDREKYLEDHTKKVSAMDFLRKNSAITLDISVGDILLGGRFKNVRTEVKEIGEDDNGQPTVNGKKLLNFRIAKKMPGYKEESMKKESATDLIIRKKAEDEAALKKYVDRVLTKYKIPRDIWNKGVGKLPPKNFAEVNAYAKGYLKSTGQYTPNAPVPKRPVSLPSVSTPAQPVAGPKMNPAAYSGAAPVSDEFMKNYINSDLYQPGNAAEGKALKDTANKPVEKSVNKNKDTTMKKESATDLMVKIAQGRGQGRGLGKPADGKCRADGGPLEHKGQKGEKEREGRGAGYISKETFELNPRSEEVKGIADELREIFDDEDLSDLIDELKGLPEEMPVTGEIIPEGNMKNASATDILKSIGAVIKRNPGTIAAGGAGAAALIMSLLSNSEDGWDKWEAYGCTPGLSDIHDLRDAAERKGVDVNEVYKRVLAPVERVIAQDAETGSTDGLNSILPQVKKITKILRDSSLHKGQIEAMLFGGMLTKPGGIQPSDLEFIQIGGIDPAIMKSAGVNPRSLRNFLLKIIAAGGLGAAAGRSLQGAGNPFELEEASPVAGENSQGARSMRSGGVDVSSDPIVNLYGDILDDTDPDGFNATGQQSYSDPNDPRSLYDAAVEQAVEPVSKSGSATDLMRKLAERSNPEVLSEKQYTEGSVDAFEKDPESKKKNSENPFELY